jgi:sucrose-phosphate synthase
VHIGLLNPQGNFDPQDRYWTEHADFGGQLVYVKELALALGEMGHRVDILTRRIVDAEWPGFEAEQDGYPGVPNVRILRFRCGGLGFRRKEDLWPVLGTEWVPAIQSFYRSQPSAPTVLAGHYADGGLSAAIWQKQGGPPFTFTAHSLGAQKIDRLLADPKQTLASLDDEFLFRRRIAAERIAMNHAVVVITSTEQERREQYRHPAYKGAIDPQDDHQFRVVPPGVNLTIFDKNQHGPEDDTVAQLLEDFAERDLAEGRRHLPAILSSSRLDRKKNITGLVRAYAESPELQEQANLLLVLRGQDDLRDVEGLSHSEREILDQIVALCDKHALWGKVSGFPLNGQQELAAAYRYLSGRRSVFALVALYEPFGLAPLEAVAAGLPVVVTQNGGPSESLRDGESEFGVLVDPEDPASISRGVLRLISSQATWDDFARLGRERVLSRYTWEATAKGYQAALDAALSKRHQEPALPIPPYFTDPEPTNDLTLEPLARIWEVNPRTV